MAIEALALTTSQPHEFGLTPQLSNLPSPTLPEHLTRQSLQIRTKALEADWNERGMRVEQKVHDTISSQTNIVIDVLTNSRKDADGPDLHVFFAQGFPIGDAWIEVKSSTLTLGQYKDKIKNSLPEEKRNMEEVHRWMTERRIILINGGESRDHEKTPEEILTDSFYPQLKRIIANENEYRKKSVQVFSALEGGE